MTDDQAAARGSQDQFDLLGEESRRLAAYWQSQLEDVRDEYRKWEKRGRAVEKRYRDERARTDAAGDEGTRRYSSLWSNVQTLLPALYARAPVPTVERRFRDRDPTGRGAAQMLERGLRNEVEVNGYDEAVGQAVLDYLLPGRGTVWVRYEPELEAGVSIPVDSEMAVTDAQGEIEPEDDSETEVKLRETGDRVVRESVVVDYLPWSDFFTFPAKARVWKEVVAGAKRVYMTRDQMRRRFGREIGDKIPLQKDDRERRRQNESVTQQDEESKKGEVYEVWSRTDQTVYWFAEGYDFLCDRRKDPLELEGFFPFPRPLFANATNNTLIPVPDYIQYQDQAIQIDELTQRISMLCKACKVAGVYNAASKDIQRLFDESVENDLIPVDSWAAFAEKGGVAGQMSLLPLKEIIGVINELDAQLDKTMAKMDRLTGITDIMRGTGDARETMGGQRLKSNNSGTRVSRRQAEVARFCRDVVRIMGDVVCRHFSVQSIVEASGALYEEGLGPKDLEKLQGQQPQLGAPPQSQPQIPQSPVPPAVSAGGAAPGATQVPPTPTVPAPGAAPAPPDGAAPNLSQPGGNVVPFPAQPQLPPGMLGAPPPPSPDPALLETLVSLRRIAGSIELLRNERLRGFRVDIEVDSTVYGDEAQEKAERVEFVGATTKFLQTAVAVGAQVPEMVPLLGKLLQFGVRGFRVGRDLEAAIEDFCDQAEESAKKRIAAAGQRPDPLQQKMAHDQQMGALKVQTEQTRARTESVKAEATARQVQTKTEGDRVRATAEVQRQQAENEGEARNADLDLQSKMAEMRMREMEMGIEKIRLQIELAKLEAAHRAATAPVADLAGAA